MAVLNQAKVTLQIVAENGLCCCQVSRRLAPLRPPQNRPQKLRGRAEVAEAGGFGPASGGQAFLAPFMGRL